MQFKQIFLDYKQNIVKGGGGWFEFLLSKIYEMFEMFTP